MIPSQVTPDTKCRIVWGINAVAKMVREFWTSRMWGFMANREPDNIHD